MNPDKSYPNEFHEEYREQSARPFYRPSENLRLWQLERDRARGKWLLERLRFKDDHRTGRIERWKPVLPWFRDHRWEIVFAAGIALALVHYLVFHQ